MTPVIGFRIWHVQETLSGPRLTSPYRHSLWFPRTALEAECGEETPDGRRLKEHRQFPDTMPPLEQCSCGVYAYHDPAEMLSGVGHDCVGGSVVCWGRVVIHEEGLRAQFARPLALARSESLFAASTDRNLARLAVVYGIPLLKASDLGLYSAEFGETVTPAAESSPWWQHRFFVRWFRP